MTAGALFAAAAAPSPRRFVTFAATFCAAVAMHALWDALDHVVAYVVLGAVSLGWLLVQAHRYRTVTAFATRSDG